MLVLGAACSSSVGGSPGPAPQAETPAATFASTAPDPAGTDPAEPTGITQPTGTPPPGTTSAPPTPAIERDDGSDGTIGRDGIGDPYYPTAGNGGYQVDAYDIDLFYDPTTNTLQSTATVTGSVTSDDGLTQFNLDLQEPLVVSSVTVNGAPAEFARDGAELVITAPAPAPEGGPLVTVVEYAGSPEAIAGGTVGSIDGGWYRTQSGGALALGQPFSASSWYPVNEHPSDIATFAVTATVPEGWQVISNGLQVTDGLAPPEPGESVFRWELSRPVASYLTMIYIDTFTVVHDELDDGTPIVSAIGPAAAEDPPPVEDTKRVIETLAGWYGPYPFEAAGGIYTGENLGFALETATRPAYGNATLRLLVHELAHQWFGDAVTIDRWSDICMNECFASYAEWMWAEDVDGTDLDASWQRIMAEEIGQPTYWSSPLVDMGPGNEFTSVYDRGPFALHALRNEIGDDAFFQLMKQWISTYDGEVASFDDFSALASEVAGRDLTPFIDAWFRDTTVPPEEFRYPGDLG